MVMLSDEGGTAPKNPATQLELLQALADSVHLLARHVLYLDKEMVEIARQTLILTVCDSVEVTEAMNVFKGASEVIKLITRTAALLADAASKLNS